MTALVALGIAVAIGAPHLLAQSRLPARTGIALWSAVLALRAALAVSIAAIAVFYLPATELFRLLTHWCLHAVIPFLATHLGFDGHQVGDAAVLVPAIVIAGCALSAGFGVWRGARAARSWLRGRPLGSGPRQSLIVGGSDVIVAAAGLRSPKVLVSTGALLRLDDAELAASLEHEWGHVAHRHRFIALLGHLFHGLSRFLPGGRRALSLLHFQLERDADDYAVTRTGDSLALASAISKAATSAPSPATPALALLGGSGVAARLRALLGSEDARPGRLATVVARGFAIGAAAFALGLVAYLPAMSSANAGVAAVGTPMQSCPG